MKALASSTALALSGAMVAGVIGTPVFAAEEKEEYVSEAEKTKLVEKALPNAEGKVIHIDHIKFPPDFVGGKHYHSGPVYVYVLDGTFAIDEEGKPTKTFETGEVYEEPIGQTMQATNKSADGPLEVLVIQVSDEGEPLMYRAE